MKGATDYGQGLLLHALPQALSRSWDLILEVEGPNLSPEMPPKDLYLGFLPSFPCCHPKNSHASARKEQMEQAGTSVPLHPGCSSGMSQVRLRNALFLGDWHREIFFPNCSMEGRRICFQKKKKSSFNLCWASFCPALSSPPAEPSAGASSH